MHIINTMWKKMMHEEKSRQHYTFERRVDNISPDPQLRLRARSGQTASLYSYEICWDLLIDVYIQMYLLPNKGFKKASYASDLTPDFMMITFFAFASST